MFSFCELETRFFKNATFFLAFTLIISPGYNICPSSGVQGNRLVSFKIASKSYEKRLFQTAPVCVRSTSEVASTFRFCELETRFSKKLRLDIPE